MPPKPHKKMVGKHSTGMSMADKEPELYSNEETKRRFEASLLGARLAAPHPMKDFVGKGERAAVKRKSRVKKTAQSMPK
jgi:hypothetical protein